MIKQKIEEWIKKKVEERFDELWELHSKEIKKELDNLRLRINILNKQIDKILADIQNSKKSNIPPFWRFEKNEEVDQL